MLACLVLGLAGFLTFGDKTVGNVLNNFSPDNSMVNVARLCFGLNMLTTLPLEGFVCREVMFTYFYPGEPFNMKLHIIFSTGLVVSAMGISLMTCDLGAIFELVGATSACTLAFILPPLCYMKLTTRSWRTYAAAVVVGFGGLVLVVSIVQAMDKIIRGECILPASLFPYPLPLQSAGVISSSLGYPANTAQATPPQRNACKGTWTIEGPSGVRGARMDISHSFYYFLVILLWVSSTLWPGSRCFFFFLLVSYLGFVTVMQEEIWRG